MCSYAETLAIAVAGHSGFATTVAACLPGYLRPLSRVFRKDAECILDMALVLMCWQTLRQVNTRHHVHEPCIDIELPHLIL